MFACTRIGCPLEVLTGSDPRICRRQYGFGKGYFIMSSLRREGYLLVVQGTITPTNITCLPIFCCRRIIAFSEAKNNDYTKIRPVLLHETAVSHAKNYSAPTRPHALKSFISSRSYSTRPVESWRQLKRRQTDPKINFKAAYSSSEPHFRRTKVS